MNLLCKITVLCGVQNSSQLLLTPEARSGAQLKRVKEERVRAVRIEDSCLPLSLVVMNVILATVREHCCVGCARALINREYSCEFNYSSLSLAQSERELYTFHCHNRSTQHTHTLTVSILVLFRIAPILLLLHNTVVA